MQSGFWGSFKSSFGWEAFAYNVSFFNENAPLEMSLLVLCRKLAPGFSLAYIPWGPELDSGFEYKELFCKELALALKKVLPKNVFFIRFDPPWHINNSERSIESFKPPFIRSAMDIQPPDSVIINLDMPMEAILEQMKPKWRYNARLAVKKGVKVREGEAGEINIFCDLLKKTAARDKIAIHSLAYYEWLLKNNYEGVKPVIKLYFAEHEGDILAGIMTLFWKTEAVYLYGASSDVKRNLMAPYALQLKAMEDAKNAGCTEYDLYGIPPNEDPQHPMAGLYRFKTGFGGSIIHRPGCRDYPCRPLLYKIFRLMEKTRKYLRDFKKGAALKIYRQ